ncbi:MAG: hypothetical protein ACTSRE_08715 [Promethearchaeota archaeon]
MEYRQKKRIFSLPELIFITSIAVLNVAFDLMVSPILIIVVGHIIAGILIMVPINFIFISLTKHLVDRIGALTLYMLVFSSIAIPTTFFGTPGVYKILIGVVIGFLLDLAYSIKKPFWLKIILGGVLGPIFWWNGVFLIWTALNFPFVAGLSNGINTIINLSGFLSLPITRINGDFFLFTLICGGLSAIQCIIMTLLTYPIAQSIKKTAIYDKFTSYE